MVPSRELLQDDVGPTLESRQDPVRLELVIHGLIAGERQDNPRPSVAQRVQPAGGRVLSAGIVADRTNTTGRPDNRAGGRLRQRARDLQDSRNRHIATQDPPPKAWLQQALDLAGLPTGQELGVPDHRPRVDDDRADDAPVQGPDVERPIGTCAKADQDKARPESATLQVI